MESVYGVQLLDDLHAYFPDVLYEPERFHTVQDLLGYIQEQAQEHFNLYSRGRRLHAASRASPAATVGAAAAAAMAAASAPAPAPVAPVPAPTPASTTSTSSSSSPAPPIQLLPTRQTRMQQTPLFTSFYQETSPFQFRPLGMGGAGAGAGAGAGVGASLLFDFGADRDDGSTHLLSSLLNLALIGGGTTNLASNFMDPVVVRPTREQINAATSVVVLSEALEANCAICQDRMEAQNPTRKINVCGHSFHKECIDTWFERSVSCPVCRHDVRQLEATPAAGAAAGAASTDSSSDMDEEVD